MFLQLLAADAAQQGGGQKWLPIVILGVFFVLMIVMTILPQKKRQKQMQSMMDNLAVGDKVMTIGRLIGKIYAIDNENKQVTLNVGTDDNETLIVIDRNAIGVVLESKFKPQTEEKPKKPNLGIGKKHHHEEAVDDTTAQEGTNDITLGNTEDVKIDKDEDVKIDNNEDVKF